MKKIIKGRKYDTATANEVACDMYNGSCSDFQWWQEALMQKRTGEYFLYGQGGAMSKYAESCGQNSWCGGSEIIPLTLDEAKRWAEEHMDADRYEEVFGEVEE